MPQVYRSTTAAGLDHASPPIVAEIFAAYDVVPFGLTMDEFAAFALAQFGRRVARLEKARAQSLAEVLATPLEGEA